MPNVDIPHLRELLAKATLPEWKEGRHDMTSHDMQGGPYKFIYAGGERVARAEGEKCIADAELIATLRNAAPALLDEIETASYYVEMATQNIRYMEERMKDNREQLESARREAAAGKALYKAVKGMTSGASSTPNGPLTPYWYAVDSRWRDMRDRCVQAYEREVGETL